LNLAYFVSYVDFPSISLNPLSENSPDAREALFDEHKAKLSEYMRDQGLLGHPAISLKLFSGYKIYK
jgi:hypothetical protein